jgi:iduronate 2-sulfatase
MTKKIKLLQELLNISCPMFDGSRQVNLLCAVNVKNDDDDDDDDDQQQERLPDMKIKDETLKYLSSLDKNDSFFLGVGFHKPHIPFHIPREYLDWHDLRNIHEVVNPDRSPNDQPSISWNPWMDVKKRDDMKSLNISFPYGKMPSLYARYIRHHYYAGIFFYVKRSRDSSTCGSLAIKSDADFLLLVVYFQP